jgi:2-dehydro-3-deoxyphosphogluconate aldolase/(4S)-4-hydroxy-2-oxoglutarate aldolase
MMQINDNVERTRDEILSEGVILAVRLDERAQVLDVCRAAIRGGLRVLEITLTTPGALEVISTMADEGAAIVGGGTVLTAEEARAVAAVGGRFVLSPVFHPEVVDEAHLRGLLAVPGTASPAEILAAHRHGARLVKVFPSGALPEVPLVPTSGPTAATAAEYFAAGACAVGVGGAEIFPPGFTLKSVEDAARRVKQAVDEARNPR